MPTNYQAHDVNIGEKRRTEAMAFYLKGMPQWKIADTLGVSRQQTIMDLKAVREEWLEQRLEDFTAIQARELAKVDLVEQTYWESFERSCQDKETTLTKAIEGRGKPTREASVRKEKQPGDPRFLDGVLKCIERRCKILGVDAPVRYAINWDQLTDKQLARLVEGDDPGRVLAEA